MLEGGGLGVFVGAIASSSSTTAGWVVLFFLVGFALILAGQSPWSSRSCGGSGVWTGNCEKAVPS